MDDMSKTIIEKLQRDGRRSYAGIGKDVGLSEAAVRQRVMPSSAAAGKRASGAWR
jgi:Lrp/AsnC family transcriptional regulator for asnA, asnC and gidA